MEYFEGKRSGQIPAFGNWDSANELPITQYFENARQAGLVRCNASALTTDNQHQYCNPYMTSARASGGGGYPIDLCAADSQKPSVRLVAVPPRRIAAGGGGGGAVNNNNGQGQGNGRRRRCGCPPQAKEQHRIKQQEVQFKVYDVVDVKQQQMPRGGGPRPRTRSQQLFYYNHNNNFDQNQKKQHLPKHYAAAAAADGNPILPHHRPSTTAAATAVAATAVNVKPVDEDLYKIPPELLLQTSKRKKMLGFFSKCLAPPCKA
ncbi:uncharacterized protein [Coffea arabica]|uniref:RPM1-interacting protein 4-like n=1 Tax=Coffea arabica TaxID=13443 RepID=A0A6P6UGV1_COFAR